MSQDLSLVSSSSVDEFVAQMAALRGNKASNVNPKIVRLDGNTGEYVIKGYNKDTKQAEDTPLKSPFLGTVILYKYFVQWKYGSTPDNIKIMSREFSDFDSPIELLRIDYSQKNKTEVIETYPYYKAFKDAKRKIDDTTKAESYPFDFWCSLYVYLHETDEIIRLKFKGDSRSAWFNFLNNYYKEVNVQDIIQLAVFFGSAKEKMAKSASQKEEKFYYRTTFKVDRLNTQEEMQKIMAGTAFLARWMKSFEQRKDQLEEAEVENVVETEDALYATGLAHDGSKEIRVEDLPF